MKYIFISAILLLGILIPFTGVVSAQDHLPELEIPQLTSPLDGASIEFTIGVQLSWKQIESIESYEIRYVKTKEDCDSIAEAAWTESSIHPTSSSFTLPTIAAGTYCWKVRAETNKDESAWSAAHKFTLETPVYEFNPGSTPPGGEGDPDPINILPGSSIFQIKNPIASDTLPELITTLLNLLFGLSLVLTPLIVLYAGFLMLTAAGDATKLQRARTILLWTVIAFAIILMARGAPDVIKSIL